MANAGDHKPNDFTPVTGALNLADYTFTITDNINKFPDYCVKEKKNEDGTITQVYVFRADSLTNRVRDMANEIFMLTYTANEINLNKQPWRKDERLTKQARAIRLCGDLLAEIQICRKHFHLSKAKVLHWGKKVRELRAAIEGWHEKDKDRYRSI